MRIEFGIFDHIEAGDGSTPVGVLYEERIALLKKAEARGFYAYHLAEHHGHSLSMVPTAAVFLAALARETTTLKLIPTVVCLPLHHPVRVFEDLAMVDVLSGGRLELGLGKGVTAFEHLYFGHDPEEASARAKEIRAMLLKGWETGIISSEGSTYYDFLEMQLPFDLQQKPYPPLWTAGNIEAAGRGGHNVLVPYAVTPELRARYDELRDASRLEPGHENPHVTEPRIGQSQALVIAETDEQAEQIMRRAWKNYQSSMFRARGLVPPHLQTEMPTLDDNPVARAALTQDPIATGLVICGSVETVRDYYVEQVRLGNANYFSLMFPFGDMTAAEGDYTLEAFANEVIPAVREVEASLVNA
jgi:alkanesulfonate monooxygenase SsuD/methylene tetrahydromethanopterin reductase-like flavin-dependent oxidoreductase (luciferase family)